MKTYMPRNKSGNYAMRGKWYTVYDHFYRSYSEALFVQPNISKTCRQLRQETLPIFYGANGFIIVKFGHKQRAAFRRVLLAYCTQIKAHVSLMNDVEIVHN
jgi:hypothetical protein